MTARWLLDTCVISELARPAPDESVREWLGRHGEACRLSAVTLGEIAYGVESLAHGARRNGLQRWSNELQHRFKERTIVTDEAVWNTYGRLKASLRTIGRLQDDLDILVAATAVVHGLQLATRNVRHFADMGVRLVNPWSNARH